MKLTKTWLSYIIWVIFSIILFADIGIAAIEIYQKADSVDFLIPIVSMYAYAILGVILIIVLYKLYEKIIMPKLEPGEPGELKGWQEGLILALIFIAAISIRAVAVIASHGELSGSTKFYDYAVSIGANRTLDTYNNGAYIYGGILSFFLKFFGYMPRAAMAVQAGIQSVTLIFLYFVVKKGIGRFAAWIALGLAAFLPGSFLGVKVCNPDGLFTMLFVIFLFCLTYLCEANREQKIRIGAHGGYYILMGLFAAFLAYYDVAGWLCVIIACVALAQSKNEDAWMKIQKTWLQILLFMITFVPAFLLMLWFVPANGLEAGPAAIVCYFTDLISGIEFNLMILSPHKGEWDALALFIMAGLWFAGFLRDKNDKAFPYALTIVVLTLMSFLGIEAYEYSALGSVAWILLATIGITSLNVFRKTEKDVEAAQKAKRNSEERKAEKERKRAEAAGEKSIRLDDVHQKKKVEEPVFEKDTSAFAGKPTVKQETMSADTTIKKSYGIGRKADEPLEVTSAVRTVDKPPVAETPVVTPVESKPAYSQGSPSRRALRHPSKSTFTPEDLERISRYTGANLVMTSMVENKVEELKPAMEDTEKVENVAAETEVVNYIQLDHAEEPSTVDSTVQVEKTVQAENAVQVENTVQAESAVTVETTAEDVKPEPVSQPVQSTPTLSYGSPVRRHYRHPSKSTFSPEELEKISQYTGVSYKQAAPVEAKATTDNTTVPSTIATETISQVPDLAHAEAEKVIAKPAEATITKPVERTIGAARVIESKPVQAPNVDVKPQAERKPKLIRNPLPGPKPHVAKELNYDYLPKESEMKFDIDDLKGRDYYDL